jgi:hypothetical protein
MTRLSVVAVGFAAIALVGACLSGHPVIAADTLIDGWSIGPEEACASDHVQSPNCGQRLSVAIRGLDRRNRHHASVVRIAMHDEGQYRDPSGQVGLVARTGNCCTVAVLELSDGSIRAIGVGTAGISRALKAFDYGPAATPSQ